MVSRRLPSSLNLLVGVWLIVAPFLLGYSGNDLALGNDVVAGIVVVALALARAYGGSGDWASWLNLAIGVWLFFAPLVLNYPSPAYAATINDMLSGLALGVLAIWSILALRRPTDVGAGVFASAEPEERDRR